MNSKPTVLVFSFIQQFFLLLLNSFRTDAYVSFFASYSSFLPGVFAWLFRKPHLIILGGTDCVSFPSIRYGNFRKPIMGWFTCQSLRMATQLAPVSENLVDSEHAYTPEKFLRQGYKNFCSGVKAPHTILPLGYDSTRFFASAPKVKHSFLTVGQVTNSAGYYRKGIDLIFNLAKKFPEYSFTIVGSSNDMQYEFIPENLTIIGFVRYEELRDIYSRHEYYLQLSIMEGFPSAVCEAMLCESVPIVSAVGALPEIIGDTGFLLERKDEILLQKLIEAAINADTSTLGKKARARIIEKFPVEKRHQLAALVDSLIEE